MLASFRAELLKLRKRPVVWLIAAAWLVMSQTFGFIVPYLGYLQDDPDAFGSGPPTMLLADLAPANLVANATAGLPIFGGTLAVILGAVVIGSEYGWGTVKTVLTQRPGRLAVYAGKLLALTLVTLLIVLVTFAVSAGSSALIANAESGAFDWPAASELLTGIAGGWLITTMWCFCGVALATVLRGMALAVGLGLVWTMVVENLISGLAAPLIDVVATVQKGLPGANAGSLVVAMGARVGEAPGVMSVVGGTQATVALLAYLAGFAAVAAVLFKRRDVT